MEYLEDSYEDIISPKKNRTSRTYGWTPDQMARINARREKQGQGAYEDSRMRSDGDYSSSYSNEYEKYTARKNTPQKSIYPQPKPLAQIQLQKSAR
jgi:hypothetical protein